MGAAPAVRIDAGDTPALRFLGFAFAAADLLFELNPAGRINVAVGAGRTLAGLTDAELTGSPWARLIRPEDHGLVEALLGVLGPGDRRGPVRVRLAGAGPGEPGRAAALSACRLPPLEPNISCALTLGGSLCGAAPDQLDAEGLIRAESFGDVAAGLIEEARAAGMEVNLDLVEIAGLAELGRSRPGSRRKVVDVLRAESFGGAGASEVGRDRFALVRTGGAGIEDLTSRVATAAGPEGVGLVPTGVRLSAGERGLASKDARALRYALDRYLEDGAEAAGATFKAAVQQTVKAVGRLESIIKSGSFELVYQPVVSLTDLKLHHFEALARFGQGESPADTIRLAEELDVIRDFDVAVARRAIQTLRRSEPDVRIAINVSARSLTHPGFAETFIAMAAGDLDLRQRILIEITETAALTDLVLAEKIIQSIRRVGHAVCLDDFGAGSASLEYLRCLTMDFVKLDGRYVRELEAGSRDAILLKHIVRLCRELGSRTIGEMVETQDTADVLKGLGVDFGQGWFFGKPYPKPVWPVPNAPAASAPAALAR